MPGPEASSEATHCSCDTSPETSSEATHCSCSKRLFVSLLSQGRLIFRAESTDSLSTEVDNIYGR